MRADCVCVVHPGVCVIEGGGGTSCPGTMVFSQGIQNYFQGKSTKNRGGVNDKPLADNSFFFKVGVWEAFNSRNEGFGGGGGEV